MLLPGILYAAILTISWLEAYHRYTCRGLEEVKLLALAVASLLSTLTYMYLAILNPLPLVAALFAGLASEKLLEGLPVSCKLPARLAVNCNGRVIVFTSCRSRILNAWVHGGEIYVERRLLQLLDRETLCTVLLHEEGHREAKLAKRLVDLTRILLVTVIVFSLYTIAYGIEEQQLVAAITSAPAIVQGVIVKWVWEHEADLYAARNAGHQGIERILAPVGNAKCSRLGLTKTLLLRVKRLKPRQMIGLITHPPPEIRLLVVKNRLK